MSGNSVEARVHSSSTVAYGNDDWKKQLLENFYEFQDLHRKLIERPHDPATIQAYEAYKKRIAEHQSYETRVSPSQLQSFSNTSLPKETPSVGGQAYPSWAEAEEKYLARTNNVKPKPIEKNVDNIITFDDLSNEQRQAYEVLRKKRREESEARRKKLEKKYEEEALQEFLASLQKGQQDNITQVGEIRSPPPRSDQIEPSAKLRQEEALMIDSMNEENKHGSASMVNSVIVKAESKSTCVESNESKEASFIQQEHGKLSKTADKGIDNRARRLSTPEAR
jgi:hypothetical protein